MAKDPDNLAGSFETENTGGLLSGFLAEEESFDRRALWRLGSWGAASVGAVIVAVLANQSAIGWRREQLASVDIVRQSQQIQSVAKESQNETRRLASAIDTLNGDRDRLYSRLTVLEQGLDSVTGSIARQNSAAARAPAVVATPVEPQAAAQNQAPAPAVAPPATTAAVAPAVTTAATVEKPRAVTTLAEPAPATVASVEPAGSNMPATTPAVPLMASKSMMAPPDAAAGKLIEPEAAPTPEVASVQPVDNAELDAAPAAAPKLAVQRTEFAVDIGTANSIGGLRTLWQALLASNTALAALRPIIVVKEAHNGLGMQLRLVAGPLGDAAAAARICAALTEGQKTCETTVFDGQRLAMQTDEPPGSIKPGTDSTKPVAHKRSTTKHPAAVEPPKKPEVSTLSALFGHR
jgi:hypothetical protein